MTRASLVVLAALAAATILNAQWLERTFRLTDSFPNLYGNVVAFTNPTSGRVYLAGDHLTQVFDPATGAKRYFTEGASGGFLHYRPVGKVFGWSDYSVWAYDDRTDTLHSLWFETNEPILALELDRRRGKFYASTEDGVEVFDAWTGQHRGTIDLYPECQSLAWDSATDRICCASDDRVYVVDCGSDSVAGFIDGVDATVLADHPLRREVISADYYGVTFSSTDSLVVLDSIRLPFVLRDPRLFVDRNGGRMYAASVHGDFDRRAGFSWSETVAVIDLATDSLCALALLDESTTIMDAALGERDGRLYVRDYYSDNLSVIGPDGSVAALAHLGKYYRAAQGTAWHPLQDRIYVVTRDTLFGVDCPTGAIVARVPYIDIEPRWLSWQRSTGRLYLGNDDGVGWVGAGDTVEHWIPSGTLELVAEDPAAGLLFMRGFDWMHNSWMATYDCVADSLRPPRFYPFSYSTGTLHVPELNRLYLWTGSSDLLVYDTWADSFLPPIPVGARIDYAAYNRHNGLMYIMGSERNTDNLIELDAYRGYVRRRIDCRRHGDIVVSPTRNEVWQGCGDYLAVYPCSTLRSQLGIRVPHRTGQLIVDSTRNKVYCVDRWITVVDCASRAVIREIDAGFLESYGISAYLDEIHGKLYVGGGPAQLVIDCHTDSVVAVLDAPGSVTTADPERDRLYAFSRWSDVISVIRDNPPGVAEGRTTLDAARITPEATIVRGVLNLPSSPTPRPSPLLLDVSGRRVLDLKSGDNDVSRLAPGVYFVRQPRSSGQAAEWSSEKVVITR
jgi:hypothetical protein